MNPLISYLLIAIVVALVLLILSGVKFLPNNHIGIGKTSSFSAGVEALGSLMASSASHIARESRGIAPR